MSLQFKRNTPRDYSNLKVLFEDTSQTSPKFFRVSDVPQVLTKGKNLLRISAHPSNLVPNSQIIVDIKDTNGDPIYFEVPDYLEQDKSRVISIWIYHDKDDFNTANGDATITIYGIARVDQNGKQVPSRYRGKHNVKWSTTINVDRDRENISPVIFKGDILPTISISESIEAYQNLPSTGTELELTTQTGGGARYIYKGRTPIVQLTDGSEFNQEMVEYSLQLGNFEVPATPETRFENPTNITSYTSSIKELIDSTTVILNAPFTTTFDDREDLTHTFTSIESAEYSISYFQTSSNIVTENQRSYANLTISNVNPISGYPNKLRVLIKSDGLPGEYELLNEVTVPFSSSLSVKLPIPSEHLEDSKRIKVQYLNSIGEISRTETITEPYKFVGGNYYFGGRNNLISGSMFISNALGSGIELGGVSSGFIRSVGFEGQTSASLGKGPGGFVIYSGSGNLQLGEDVLTGVGMQMVGDNDDRHLIFTTDNGGLLDVKTDKFFIGTTDTQFISGSDGNIEISSSLFHLDPQNNLLVIGADAVINADLTVNNLRTPALINGVQSTRANSSSSIDSDGFARFVSASIGGFEVSETQINSANDNLILKDSGQITGSNVSFTGGTIAGFEISNSQINSTNNNIILKANGQLTASDGFLFGDKDTSQYVQYDDGNLVVRGDLSVDQIFTPAIINGSPANITNASSSITSDGFAKFVSASIGGWSVDTGSIQGSNIIMLPEGTIQTKDFATNVKGWKISSIGNGTAEFENVRIRGTLSTTTFEKESVNAVGGQLYVANSTTISGSFYEVLSPSDTLYLHNGTFPAFDYATIDIDSSGLIDVLIRDTSTILTLSGSYLYQSSSYVLNYEVTASETGPDATLTFGSSFFVDEETTQYIATTGVTASAGIFTSPYDNFGTLTIADGAPAELVGTYNIVSIESTTNLTIDTALSDSGSGVAASLVTFDYINTGSYSTGTVSVYSSSLEITGSISADATTFIVKNATGFVPNEILTAKKVNDTGFATEYMQIVTSSVFDPSGNDFSGTITVVRGYGSSSLAGLNPEDMQFLGDLVSISQSYEEGQVLASTGVIGTGYIRLNANPRDQSTPYIDIVERIGSGVYDVVLKARLGDLSGLANSTYVFGNPNPGFGLATDNVFLQGGIIANTGSIGGINMDAGKLYTGVGTWGNSNTGFYVDSESSMSLSDKLRWDGTQLTISGVINIESGTGFATQSDINTATGSLSSSISTTINDVSGSISTTINDVSGSIVNTISTVSGSIATDIASNVDKIVTDANNKIVKPNPAPSGDGLFLASTNMGYYDNSDWNAYISSSGEFLFKADDDNLISFGNSSFVLKVSDQAVISGSQISLLTPNFFFGGTNQFISGANSNIEISSSNFHLQPNGDVVIGGGATIEEGAVFGVLPTLPSNEKLKVYIPFEEGAGDKVFNHATEKYPATLNGSYTRVSGSNTAYGNSIFFEGGYLTFDGNPSGRLLIHEDVAAVSQSMTVWLNTPSASISTPQVVYEQNGSANGQALIIKENTVYWYMYASSGATKNIVSCSISDNELTCIGTIIDEGDDVIRIYKNGLLQQEEYSIINFGGAGSVGVGAGNSVTILTGSSDNGTQYETTGDLPYYGMMDEIRIYKEALTSANFLALYQNPGGISSTTKITGDNISTGQIKSNNLSTTKGTLIDLNGEVFKIGGTSVTPTSGEGIVLDGSVTDQPKFFVGNTSNAFVRFGETAGALEISSSGFSLDTTGAITATEGTIGGITIDSGKLFTGDGTWGNSNTGFYVDSESSMSLSDKLRWDGTQLTISGVINIESGTGFATQANINTATGSLSSSIATSITTVSSSFSSSLNGVSGSIVNTISTVSGSIATSLTEFANSIYIDFNESLGLDSDRWSTIGTIAVSGSSDGISLSKTGGANWSALAYTNQKFYRKNAPVIELDLKHEASAGGNMYGIVDGPNATPALSQVKYALYILNNLLYIRTYANDGSEDSIAIPYGTYVRARWTIKPSGGALLDIFFNGNLDTPVLSFDYSSGTETEFNIGSIILNSSYSTKMLQLAAGGGSLSTGQIVSQKIVTDINNKITKPNPAPSGDGLFLASSHMGYYDSSAWNAYISSSGEFLFKADNDNLISFGNNSFVLKVSDQAVISGSQISLLTPNFFFGGPNQFISGANSNIEISSSNFHLDSNGDVTLSGTVTAGAGEIGGFSITPTAISSSNNNLILRSNGQITGSNMLLETPNFTVIDTANRIIDGKNVARQLWSSNSVYTDSAGGTGSFGTSPGGWVLVDDITFVWLAGETNLFLDGIGRITAAPISGQLYGNVRIVMYTLNDSSITGSLTSEGTGDTWEVAGYGPNINGYVVASHTTVTHNARHATLYWEPSSAQLSNIEGKLVRAKIQIALGSIPGTSGGGNFQFGFPTLYIGRTGPKSELTEAPELAEAGLGGG
jgi:hypothetical protein